MFRQLQEDARDIQLLSEIGRNVASSLNLDDIYGHIDQTLRTLIPFDRMTLRIIDAELTTAIRTYFSGIAPDKPGLGEPGPFSGTAAEAVAHSGEAIIVAEDTIDSVAELYPSLLQVVAKLRSLILIPVISDDVVIAILALRKAEPNAYNDRHLELGKAVATHLASAITNARLHDIAEREAKEMNLLAEIGRTVSLSSDINDMYHKFSHLVEGLIQFDRLDIHSVSPDSEYSTLAYVSGLHFQNLSRGQEYKSLNNHLFEVVKSKNGMIYSPQELKNLENRYASVTDPSKSGNYQSYLSVPIISHDQVVGLLAFRSTRVSAYNERSLRLAQLVSDQVAGAVTNSRLLDEVSSSNSQLRALSSRVVEVQERERRYIANELHDEIGQILTGVKLNLESTLKIMEGQSKSQVSDSIELISDLTDRVRDLSLELRPAVLDDLGLLPALQSHIKRYFAQTGVKVNFEHDGLDRRFSSIVETAAYRIVQEALTNVARYSGGFQGFVKVYVGGNTLMLLVEDRGVGFDLDSVIASGRASGLAGMRERATSVGGVFRIESRPGDGTEVTAEIPLDSKRG